MRVKKEIPKLCTVDILCDICGRSCVIPYASKDDHMEFEYGTLTPDFGMSEDEAELRDWDLCQPCYQKVESFVSTMAASRGRKKE